MDGASRQTLTLLRSLRRDHRRAREKAVDGVTATIAVLLVVGFLGQLVVGLITISAPDNPGFVRWSVIGLTVILAGTVLAALSAVGPIAASRASVSILLSAPVSRRAVLARRWVLLLALRPATGGSTR